MRNFIQEHSPNYWRRKDVLAHATRNNKEDGKVSNLKAYLSRFEFVIWQSVGNGS
jgi:hypothetical protein